MTAAEREELLHAHVAVRALLVLYPRVRLEQVVRDEKPALEEVHVLQRRW